MIDEIQTLLDRYRAWLKERTSLRQIDEWVEIITPFPDRHKDCIQLYARCDDGAFVITDDGHTILDLEQSGCSIDRGRRKDLFRTVLNGFCVQMNNQALEVRASSENFGLKKHSLVQAMLAVDDLFYLATPVVASLFFEDAVSWLDLSDIRFTSRVKFTGKSGYDHGFDFVIHESLQKPERLLRTINRANKEVAELLAFSRLDTNDVRPQEARAYASLNDSERQVPADVMDALKSYDVRPVLWSARESILGELAA